MFNYDILSKLKPDEILVYLRKSRTDDPTLSVEEVLTKHETILDEWAEHNLGERIPEKNKYREVVSGETISDRPEVQKVLKLIESPKIKAILIVEVQRISRGDLEDAGRLIKLLRYTDTLVITPMKTFDLKDEYDRDIFERELKRGNEFLEYQKKIMNRGRLLSVSQGNFIASQAPYGYDKIFVMEGKRKCPTLAVNEEQAEVVRMIYDMYVYHNMGADIICKRLDELHIAPPKKKYWSAHSVRDILTNIHYLGKVTWNWRKTIISIEDGEVIKSRPRAKDGDYFIYDGKHPAIISEEVFNLAQEKAGRNHRAKSETKVRNPLAGLVRCKCGRKMTMRISKRSGGKELNPPRLVCDNNRHCDTRSCLLSEMIDVVANILKEKITEFEIAAASNDKDNSAEIHAKLIKNLEKKLLDIDAREVSLWESQVDPDVSNRMPPHVFQTIITKLVTEREETQSALDEAYETMPTPIDYSEKIVTFTSALTALLDDDKSAAEKNNLLKKCIQEIDYERARAERLKGSGNKGAWGDAPIKIKVKLKV